MSISADPLTRLDRLRARGKLRLFIDVEGVTSGVRPLMQDTQNDYAFLTIGKALHRVIKMVNSGPGATGCQFEMKRPNFGMDFQPHP
jgi:hypothetical protein